MVAKTKKTRLKQAAQVAAQSKDDVVAYIREIGDLSRERDRLAATMNDGIAELQEQYANDAAPLNERIEALQDSVQLWCEANRMAITDGGKVKFADFVPAQSERVGGGCRSGTVGRQSRAIALFARKTRSQQRGHPQRTGAVCRRAGAGHQIGTGQGVFCH